MATKKRETKAEKEAREKAALRAKFLDIAAGARGEAICAENGFVEFRGGPGAMGRFAGALASIYQGDPRTKVVEASEWSDSAPTVEGWYWFFGHAMLVPTPMNLVSLGSVGEIFAYVPHGIRASELDGFWRPMVPPEFPEHLRKGGSR